MLSPLDDFPVHQAPRPLAVPATTDHNAYDRYWFGGFERAGRFIVEAAFGRYPNLGVVDASLSISIGGQQHAFHACRWPPSDPTETVAGPMRVTITEPMRALRIDLDGSETGLAAELHWQARIGALLEDHTVMQAGPATIVDMSRFLQFGTWTGSVTVDGVTTELIRGEVVGARDRSWGIRPVGQHHPGGVDRPPTHGCGRRSTSTTNVAAWATSSGRAVRSGAVTGSACRWSIRSPRSPTRRRSNGSTRSGSG